MAASMEQCHELSLSNPFDQQYSILSVEVLLEACAAESIGQYEHKPSIDDLCEKSGDEPKVIISEPDLDNDNETHYDCEAQRGSTDSTISQQGGIYRRTPMVMISGLLLGISFSVGLDRWYNRFDGRLVGDARVQQQVLRAGTALALCAQVCLIFSIRKANHQWLWRELKSRVISFKGIDAACAASNDPCSFANPEIWRKTKRATVLALLIWLIPIATWFAPASLSVQVDMRTAIWLMNIPTLYISQAAQYTSYTYTVAGTPLNLLKYLGPRTIMMRMTVAAASIGDILPLLQPYTNATYEQTIYGPYIYCASSNNEVIHQTNGMIDRFKQAQDPTVELVSLDYFVQVPALSNFVNISGAAVQVANLTDMNGYAHASNQLWIYFQSYNASHDFSRPVEKHYLTCELYNASFVTQFRWENGRQAVQVMNRTLLHTVSYPANASTSPESEEVMAYSSLMWAVSTQLTGSIAFYKDLNAADNVATQGPYANRVYSEISSNIANTKLVGTSDCNSHFAENHLLGNGSGLYSTQRLQDMAYAGDRPLDILIPELSSNITFSLLSDPLLAPGTPTNVTITSPANIYQYNKRSLLIPYGITDVVALLANMAGLYAIIKSGVSHDLSFSSIVCASQGVHFSRVLRVHERLGALPLGSRIANARLAFFWGQDGRYGWGDAPEACERKGGTLRFWRGLGHFFLARRATH